MLVYLAGGINGLSDAAARDWRTFAKTQLVHTLDPMRRDYRGIEAQHVDEIVHGDLADIDACTHVLAMCTRPSWGTAMELRYAWEHRKPIFAVMPNTADAPISPWLAYHCRIFFSLEAAIFVLLADAKKPG